MQIPTSPKKIEEVLSHYLMYYLSGYESAAPEQLCKLLAFCDWASAAQREVLRRASPALLEIIDDQSLQAIADGTVRLEDVLRAMEQKLGMSRADFPTNH